MVKFHYKPQNITSYFKIPVWVDEIPPEYKKLRSYVGAKYGDWTLYGTFLFIVIIPLITFLNTYRTIPRLRESKSKLIHHIIYHSTTTKVILFWGLFHFILNYIDTYDDLLFITKRLGRVSAASLPGLLFLTLRPSPLPKTLYLLLLPVHKWISRIVVLEGLIHTVLYIVYYNRLQTLAKLWKWQNIMGFIAMFAFILIGITSLPKIRRFAFKTFYISHYVMTWISVIALHFHARPGIASYTVINCIILFYQIWYRVKNTELTKVSITSLSPTLALLEFPTSKITKVPTLPGGHVRINNKSGFLKDLFFQIIPLAHPFTIASLPNDHTTKLIIRRGNFPLKADREYYITGAFEPELDFIQEQKSLFQKLLEPRSNLESPFATLTNASPMKYNIEAQRVLIVVGGSGISFGIPLMRILNYNGIGNRLIWVCRDIGDLNLLNHFHGIQGIECYITSDVQEDDIVIDYYEDKNHENLVQRIPNNYGSIEEEVPDEIDFTTLGRSYKKAHSKSKPQSKSSSYSESSIKHFEENENVNIDISGTCKFKQEQLPTIASPHIGPKSSKDLIQPPEDFDLEAFKSIKVPKSVNIYYGRPNLGSEHYNWCLQSNCVGPTYSRDGETVCCRDIEQQHQIDRNKVWVVAAGPTGLVDHAKEWATDGGLQCHVESFSV